MRIRTSTVIWAAILLVLAAVAFSVAVFDLREFQAAAAAWIVTGLGGVFVVAALIALIARSARKPLIDDAAAAPPAANDSELPTSVGVEATTPAKVGNSRKKAGETREADQPVD